MLRCRRDNTSAQQVLLCVPLNLEQSLILYFSQWKCRESSRTHPTRWGRWLVWSWSYARGLASPYRRPRLKLHHGFTHKGDGRGHRRIQRRGSRWGVQLQGRRVHRGRPAHTQRLGILRKHTLELYGRPSATLELEIRMLRAEELETILYAFVTLRARARATATRCADPTIAFWLAASVGKRTITPTTRFSIWTRLWKREMRASRRLCARGGSCSRDLWRAWRTRDCRDAQCSENYWWARAACGAWKRVVGVFPGRPQSFWYQRRPVDDCSPGERDRCRECQGWTTACSRMPKRGGMVQGQDIPKQACSCRFARHSWLLNSHRCL